MAGCVRDSQRARWVAGRSVRRRRLIEGDHPIIDESIARVLVPTVEQGLAWLLVNFLGVNFELPRLGIHPEIEVVEFFLIALHVEIGAGKISAAADHPNRVVDDHELQMKYLPGFLIAQVEHALRISPFGNVSHHGSFDVFHKKSGRLGRAPKARARRGRRQRANTHERAQ